MLYILKTSEIKLVKANKTKKSSETYWSAKGFKLPLWIGNS